MPRYAMLRPLNDTPDYSRGQSLERIGRLILRMKKSRGSSVSTRVWRAMTSMPLRGSARITLFTSEAGMTKSPFIAALALRLC